MEDDMEKEILKRKVKGIIKVLSREIPDSRIALTYSNP
jgi:hypothetical protein